MQAKDCMMFAGTAVSNGSCMGLVNSIGMRTEIGKIQQQIHEASLEEEDTPLKKKLDLFGERLAQARSSSTSSPLITFPSKFQVSCCVKAAPVRQAA